MRLRSLEQLDLPLAWARVLGWARRRIEVPDRLPFEIVNRVSGVPQIGVDHHPAPIIPVMSTKGSGTARPFVRVSPADLTLYQALTDALAPTIESGLGDRGKVFAYRQTLDGSADPFQDSPSWSDFILSVRSVLEGGWYPFALTADVASYFVYIELDELERLLLGHGAQPDVVHDLLSLLRAWRGMGVQGLPQALPPSSPLGNFYLTGLDKLLVGESYEHRRYMDDLWVFAPNYSDGRRLQDLIERHLYEMRLSLGGEKSRILRTATALSETQMAKERIEQRADAIAAEMLEGIEGGYDEVAFFFPNPDEIDEAAVIGEYEEVLEGIRLDEYPPGLRSRLIEIYRQFEALDYADAVSEIPEVLQRFPDLTGPAFRYAANTSPENLEQALATFLSVLDEGRFHRDHELLLIFRAVLWLPNGSSEDLAEVLARYAAEGQSWLLRARALLGWGAQSSPTDFDAADRFWATAGTGWQTYALVAIQNKAADERDRRYANWSGEGRFLRELADSIREGPFGWRQL